MIIKTLRMSQRYPWLGLKLIASAAEERYQLTRLNLFNDQSPKTDPPKL